MTDTARMLDDTAERLFARHLSDPMARLDATLPQRLAEAVAEAGLGLTLLPEVDGGLGATLAEAAVIAWRAGYHAAPLPVVSLLLGPLLPCDKALLAAPGRRASEGPGTRIALIDAQGLTLFATEPAFHALDHRPWVQATGPALQRNADPALASRLAMQGACLTCAAMLGAMRRSLEITIDHANTRKQFGRPLSAFQAIQHRLAEAASELTVAEAALSGALDAAEDGWLRPILWQSAKMQAGRAATIVSAAAHQILGAIGFTEEHLLHHFSKRLWVWRDDWGRQAVLGAAIGAAAVSDARGLWQHLVDSDSKGTAA